MNRLLLLSTLLLGACSSLALHESLDESLPPAAERGSIGAWKLGDNNCTGAIQTAEGRYYWVNDCISKIGYGWCDFGLRIEKRSERQYVNRDHDWSFTIEEDGSLTQARKGQKLGNYTRSDVGICKVRVTG